MTAISTKDPAPDLTPVNLSLQDLHVCSEIIQVVSARGAIKPEEMEAVGTVYTKLVTFLKQAGAYNPQQPEVAGQNPQPTAPTQPQPVATMPTTVVEEKPVGAASAPTANVPAGI